MADIDEKIPEHAVIGTRLLRAGDHCVRPPGAVHSAFSEQGADVLVIYTPA